MNQRTEEWFRERAGKVTASRVSDVIAKTKSGYSASRANYRAQLVAERLSGIAQEGFSNAAMQWGTDTEPQARDVYAFATGLDVVEVGFIRHPAIEMAGASPDGLVCVDGLLEIKCPNTATHLETLLSREIPAKYVPQMAWQMACTGRAWCDFVSFDPRLPAKHQIFIQRYHRDEKYIKELEADVSSFLEEVESIINQLEQAA